MCDSELIKNNIYLYTLSTATLHFISLLKLYFRCASVSNEEDVCLQTGHNVPSYDRTFVSTNLTDAIAKLRKTLRGNNTATEKHEFQALLIRFEFFSSLLEMFDFLLPSKGTLYLLNAGINETEIDPFVPNLYSAGEQLQKCLHFHKRILATINFGKQPPKDERDSLFDWLSTFDSNTYLYMSTAGLPRKLQLFSRLEGYKYIEDTLETIGEIIMSVPDYVTTTWGILELVKKFGDLHSNILTRSVLQLILFPLNRHNLTGTIPFMQIAFNSVNRFCGYLMNNNIQDVVAQHNSYFPHLNVLFNEIFGLFERAYTCLYQTHGNNLARQWDFFHVNFDDFSILINELEDEMRGIRLRVFQTQGLVLSVGGVPVNDDADVNEHTKIIQPMSPLPSLIERLKLENKMEYPLSNFFLYTTLETMHHYFWIGFQLRLFLPFEFIYVYWYFGEVVARTLNKMTYNRINNLLLEFHRDFDKIERYEKERKLDRIAGSPTSRSKRSRSRSRTEEQYRSRNESKIFVLQERKLDRIALPEEEIIEAIMSRGMFKMMVGLITSKEIVLPEEEMLRYNRRFMLFSSLNDMIYYDYERYLEYSKLNNLLSIPSKEHFLSAAQTFDEVATFIKKYKREFFCEANIYLIEAINVLETTASKNAIVAKLLTNNKLNKELSIDFTNVGHCRFLCCFPTFLLKNKK
uniref:Protein MAK10 homolog n=1 Tax=Meloidogyne floridensis TaxID=298350 RepID=A0A915NU55_9BILA